MKLYKFLMKKNKKMSNYYWKSYKNNSNNKNSRHNKMKKRKSF